MYLKKFLGLMAIQIVQSLHTEGMRYHKIPSYCFSSQEANETSLKRMN